MPVGTVSRSLVRSPVVSPNAALVSSGAGALIGSVVSNASVSLPSLTVICTRAVPTPRAVASKRTGSVDPASSLIVCDVLPANCSSAGSRLLIVTDGVAAGLERVGHDRAERRAIVQPEEARKRGEQRQRLVDFDLDGRRSESRGRVRGHRHDAIGRERLGQRDVLRRVTGRVCLDGPEPEGERPEVAPEIARAAFVAATAAVLRALRRQHAPADDALPAVFVHHLQRLLAIHRAHDVRDAIVGQRQNAVVHGPQRDLARRRPACRVGHGHRDLRLARRAVFRPIGRDLHVEPLRRVLDADLRVAQPERRLARVAAVRARILRRPAANEQHGDVQVGNVLLGDRHFDSLLRGRQIETLVPAARPPVRRSRARWPFPTATESSRAPCRRVSTSSSPVRS